MTALPRISPPMTRELDADNVDRLGENPGFGRCRRNGGSGLDSGRSGGQPCRRAFHQLRRLRTASLTTA